MTDLEGNILLNTLKEGCHLSSADINNALVATGDISATDKIDSSENWRRECEVKFWSSSYKIHVKTYGKTSAYAWWGKIKADIKKARGEAALKALLEDIQRSENEASG